MITEIKQGDRFLCVKSVVMTGGGDITYHKGIEYKSDFDGCITNHEGCEQHNWNGVASVNTYFKLINQSTEEAIKPDYYKFNIKGVQCDMFDISEALELPVRLFSALKYFRKKGDTAKQINDLEKAKECIDLEIKRLKELEG